MIVKGLKLFATDNSDARIAVYQAIDSERKYQDSDKGNGRAAPSIGEEIALMEVYLATAKAQWATWHNDEAMKTIRKVTAMGVRAMEHHGAKTREEDHTNDTAEL